MQQVLFVPEPILRQEQSSSYPGLKTREDIVNPQSEEAEYTSCIRQILEEEFLWDMRCWEKPKYQYTRQEVQAKILQWVKDHEQDNWSNNCGHCVYCLRVLLFSKTLTIEEIANLVWRKNKIKYYNQINTCKNGIEEE